MTLNQVIERIKTICLAHKQVRSFFAGLEGDLDADHTLLYPNVYLADNGGTLSLKPSGVFTLNYKIILRDLVNESQDTKTNEQEVQSDLLSIALDIIAQMSYPEYSDWRIEADSIDLVLEDRNDMTAAVGINVSITCPFTRDACAVPSDLTYDAIDPSTGTTVSQKTVYDLKYTANGTEGTILTLSELKNQKILLIVREGTIIYKVSNLPSSSEFTWNDTNITLGTQTNPNERFLILYRNY